MFSEADGGLGSSFHGAPHKGSKLEYVRDSAGLGVMSLAEIRLQEGESLENALRRFKRKVMTEDIIKEVKRHSYYLKPGEKRRVKQALARKRARKKLRKARLSFSNEGRCCRAAAYVS